MMKKRIFAALAAGSMLVGCGQKEIPLQSVNLAADVQPKQSAEVLVSDASFEQQQTAFALGLLQESLREYGSVNQLISPYSVMQALAMTTNGAAGETRTQMEEALGGMPVARLNGYLNGQRNGLPHDADCNLQTANALWLRDAEERFAVAPAFVQTNADYFGASVFRSDFGEQTLRDINQWCARQTDNKITQLLDEINQDAVMYLVNAVLFEAEWEHPYTKAEQVYDIRFTMPDGKAKATEFMFSDESRYLADDMATGFLKPYAGGRYAFAAILPNEDVSVVDYTAQLTAEKFQQLLANQRNVTVEAGLPRFQYDFEIGLATALKHLGMTDAFDPDKADFSEMGKTASGMLYLNEVLHKTHITVDTKGTTAAALAAAEMVDSCEMEEEKMYVVCNRPFLYAIVDTETNLPVFLGILTNPF